MIERPLEQLTVRELLTEAERLTREVSDHLENGFVPRVQHLMRLVRPAKDPQDEMAVVEDGVVRNHAKLVLESDRFTDQLYDKLLKHCESLNHKVSEIVSGS